jgi:hypothetical protein
MEDLQKSTNAIAAGCREGFQYGKKKVLIENLTNTHFEAAVANIENDKVDVVYKVGRTTIVLFLIRKIISKLVASLRLLTRKQILFMIIIFFLMIQILFQMLS